MITPEEFFGIIINCYGSSTWLPTRRLGRDGKVKVAIDGGSRTFIYYGKHLLYGGIVMDGDNKSYNSDFASHGHRATQV